MSTHTAIFAYYAGATLDDDSDLCHRTTDATVYTAESTGEKNVGGAVYEAVFEDIAEGGGSYCLKFKSGGGVVGTRLIRFTGVDGEVVDTRGVELDSSAIESITDPILAAIQGAEVIQVASPNVSGNLVLTQGDSYDGIANPKASWNVTTDYTDGWSVALTIRGEDDAIIYSTEGEVVSATVVAVTIASPTGLTMSGCPGQWQGKFDVELTKAGSKKTIALGVCYINEDQTR